MNLLPLKKVKELKPPFQNDGLDLIEWVKPITVVCKGDIRCGGIAVSESIIATTAQMTNERPAVILPNGSCFRATRIDYESKLFLSFYQIPKIPWVGLPRFDIDDLEDDSFLFSYIPYDWGCEPLNKKERLILWKTVTNEDSKSFGYAQKKESARIEYKDLEHTFPVVDQYGYFVGLGIGTSFDECLVLRFENKTTKL